MIWGQSVDYVIMDEFSPKTNRSSFNDNFNKLFSKKIVVGLTGEYEWWNNIRPWLENQL